MQLLEDAWILQCLHKKKHIPLISCTTMAEVREYERALQTDNIA